MTNISFFSGSTNYVWEGTLGSVFFSNEFIIEGTVRYILGELFYCWRSRKKSGWDYPACTDWIPVDKTKQNMEWIREFKKKICDL